MKKSRKTINKLGTVVHTNAKQSEPPGPEVQGNPSEAGVSNLLKKSRLGRLKFKWSHSENRMLWKCYVESNPAQKGYMNRLYDLWKNNEMRELSAQRLSVQVRNIKSKNILSTVEREEIENGVTGGSLSTDHTHDELIEIVNLPSDEEELEIVLDTAPITHLDVETDSTNLDFQPKVCLKKLDSFQMSD